MRYGLLEEQSHRSSTAVNVMIMMMMLMMIMMMMINFIIFLIVLHHHHCNLSSHVPLSSISINSELPPPFPVHLFPKVFKAFYCLLLLMSDAFLVLVSIIVRFGNALLWTFFSSPYYPMLLRCLNVVTLLVS